MVGSRAAPRQKANDFNDLSSTVAGFDLSCPVRGAASVIPSGLAHSALPFLSARPCHMKKLW
jgi:hypothetical protein